MTSRGQARADGAVTLETLTPAYPEILWASPRSGAVKRLLFLAPVAAGASVMLVAADPADGGSIRAYRAEECRLVES